MARWAIIRVAASDGPMVMQCLAAGFVPVTMRVDVNPPASGPEWEFRVQDVSVEQLEQLLGADLILASRNLLDPALRTPELRTRDLPPKPLPRASDPRDELAPADPRISPYFNPPAS